MQRFTHSEGSHPALPKPFGTYTFDHQTHVTFKSSNMLGCGTDRDSCSSHVALLAHAALEALGCHDCARSKHDLTDDCASEHARHPCQTYSARVVLVCARIDPSLHPLGPYWLRRGRCGHCTCLGGFTVATSECGRTRTCQHVPPGTSARG